jgi:hypothetical protein
VKCIRCPLTGTVLVHQVDAGNMQGDNPGPRTGNVYACVPHAADIGSEPGAWPWLTQQVTAMEERAKGQTP